MTKLELMQAASKRYPNDSIIECVDTEGNCTDYKSGDTLAWSIAFNLSETFDDSEYMVDEDQILNAVQVLNSMIADISNVIQSIVS